jgi:hypothetical protein
VNTEVAREDTGLCLPYLVECIRGHMQAKTKNRGQPCEHRGCKGGQRLVFALPC